MFNEFVVSPITELIRDFPEYNAFCIREKFYTYKDLGEYISKIRMALRSHEGINKNIGLVVNDDIETYASIFAIWLDGYAYVPLHPQQPPDRIEEITSQAQVHLVIDSGSPLIFSISVIKSSLLEFQHLDIKPLDIPENNLAYILFTSGSTGKPKGVPILRKNVGSFMKAFWEVGIKLDHNDRCLQCFDLTFDVSIQSFLAPLTMGSCTYTIPHDQIKYSYVFGLLEDHKLTFGAMAPSMIRYLRPYFSEIVAPSMRCNILTAEASPVDLIREWAACIPNAEIYNFYGPTEATIYCTYFKYEKDRIKQLNGLLSIGKPMNGIVSIIVDENGSILPVNEKGQLCIAGDQLTPGYWNNPEKNIESFFETIIEGKNRRFYKTGDLCFVDEEGDIMYSGRLDFQVKIQGYRVELGEIEFHSREFLRGQNAVAIAHINLLGNIELVLFVESQQIDKVKLSEYLKSKVPRYMIPASVQVMLEFPLNSSGKVDRKVLKEMIKS